MFTGSGFNIFKMLLNFGYIESSKSVEVLITHILAKSPATQSLSQ
jgi:hypothetical protein